MFDLRKSFIQRMQKERPGSYPIPVPLTNLSDKKLSPEELSEAVRPVISSLLIQKISGVKEALNIVTFNPDFEQMLITMSKKSSAEGLLIDPSLAKEMIQSTQYASTSYLQRKLRIGYNRAARLMDELEEHGVISAYDSESKTRTVLPS